MAKKQKTDIFEADNESYLNRSAKQERKRSLENLEQVKAYHRDYLQQHGRTWLEGYQIKNLPAKNTGRF